MCTAYAYMATAIMNVRHIFFVHRTKTYMPLQRELHTDDLRLTDAILIVSMSVAAAVIHVPRTTADL